MSTPVPFPPTGPIGLDLLSRAQFPSAHSSEDFWQPDGPHRIPTRRRGRSGCLVTTARAARRQQVRQRSPDRSRGSGLPTLLQDLAGDRPADVINAYNAVYASGAYPVGALLDRLPQHLIFALALVVLAADDLGRGRMHACCLVFVLLAGVRIAAAVRRFRCLRRRGGQGVGLQPVPGLWPELGPGPLTRR